MLLSHRFYGQRENRATHRTTAEVKSFAKTCISDALQKGASELLLSKVPPKMKIATNAPFSFPLTEDFEFFQLGDRASEASMIVLMLPKNWGASSVGQIRAMAHLVSTYPKEVPCYIIGCETTIPSMDLTHYLHKPREEAVRALCDEVLTRSKSIGVRGEITYHYLTDLLGYSESQVDLIYASGRTDNAERVRQFLKKNQCEIQRLASSVLAFQAAPSKFTYGRDLAFKKEIIIHPPYLTTSETGARLNADIEINGQTKTLWCETDEAYRQYLLSERADAFLCAILPFAMRSGRDIVCKAPVTEQFLHNLSEILVPQLCAYDSRLYRTRITAVSVSASISTGDAVATGMSCGVDSLYAASLYKSSPFKSMNLTHLYVGNYLYGNGGEIYERAERVARDMDLPLVRTSTNINQMLHLPHLPTHFFKTMFGVLSLRKLFRIYYYATTEDFSHFDLMGNGAKDTSHIELLLLYVFSCSDIQIVTGGVKSERAEKTRSLANFETATKFLNVCLNPHLDQNCGKCGKCRRTLLTLDRLDLLDRFHHVFPIEEYRRTRFDSLVYLFSHKRSSYLAEVYKYFLQTEPVLMQQAEEEYLRQSGKRRKINSEPVTAEV